MAELKLSGVRKAYGATTVLHGIDLDVADGEFVVFVGPSGCGKSTLLRSIAGLEEITGGTIAIDGTDATHLPASERGLAMVFQSYALYPHMSVYANMAFALENMGFKRDEIDRRVKRAAGMLRLTDYLDRKPKALSGGQRQRVAIGRAIVRDPKVFLFDKPLSNLDAALRVQTRIEIAKLHHDMHNTTMIYVTHDQVEAMTLADRICVLRDGLVEQVGTPLELYEKPQSLFVAGFIGSPKMNFLNGQYADAYKAHTLGVRAEHLRINDNAGDGTWQGQVVHSENLGSDSYVYIDIGADEPLIVRQDGTTGHQPGETLGISPTGTLHRFDAAGKPMAA